MTITPNPGWTDDRVEKLKMLWAEGLSCSAIAVQLRGVSRNAVIGKVYRLGLSGREAAYKPGRPVAETKAPAAPRQPRPATIRVSKARTYTMPTSQPLPALKDSAIATLPRPWLTRLFGECAYPVGGDGADTLSCCAPIGDTGGCYCRAHRKVMFAKPATDAQRQAAARARAARTRGRVAA